MNEAEKLHHLARLRSLILRQRFGGGAGPRPAAEDGMSRRDFLARGATLGAAGAAALALGGGSALLAGCGGSNEGGLNNNDPIAAGTRLLVSTFLEGTVEALDPNTGRSVGTFFPRVNTDTTTAGVRAGAGGRVYIFSPGANRFYICDAATGQVRREVVLRETQTPHCGAVGPDGNLYVVNAPSLNNRLTVGPDSVEVFTPDGDRLRTFISGADTPEMRSPFGIAWGPDGNLYVTSVLAYLPFADGSDYVSRYDGQTGRFLGYVARSVKVPFNINFHPDGYLMVIEHFYNRVALYDLNTGKLKDAFADADFCIDAQFGPDGTLYMTSFTDMDGIEAIFDNRSDDAKNKGRILRYDGKNGKKMGTVADKLVFSGYIAFV
jgi:sugar lactone lactonase YvrE